jgi:hypothetical protein
MGGGPIDCYVINILYGGYYLGFPIGIKRQWCGKKPTKAKRNQLKQNEKDWDEENGRKKIRQNEIKK